MSTPTKKAETIKAMARVKAAATKAACRLVVMLDLQAVILTPLLSGL
jgi:hypothetical protein